MNRSAPLATSLVSFVFVVRYVQQSHVDAKVMSSFFSIWRGVVFCFHSLKVIVKVEIILFDDFHTKNAIFSSPIWLFSVLSSSHLSRIYSAFRGTAKWTPRDYSSEYFFSLNISAHRSGLGISSTNAEPFHVQRGRNNPLRFSN